jgi:hypothetical protein
MTRLHPQAQATYQVVPADGGGFTVEVRVPDADTALVKGFTTTADAENWVAGQKQRVNSWQPRTARRFASPR